MAVYKVGHFLNHSVVCRDWYKTEQKV